MIACYKYSDNRLRKHKKINENYADTIMILFVCKISLEKNCNLCFIQS